MTILVMLALTIWAGMVALSHKDRGTLPFRPEN